MPFCQLSQIKSPRLQQFASYLDGKLQSESPLDRASIDPVIEIPRLAGAIVLIEKIRDGEPYAGRFRIRLAGSELVALAGRDATGKWLDEVDMSPDQLWPFTELEAIFAESDILYGYANLPWEIRAHVTLEWVALHFARVATWNDLVIFAFDKQSTQVAR